MSTDKIEIVIVGGTGFGAGELLRLFLHHPHVTIHSVVSSSSAGKSLYTAHPHLRGLYDQHIFKQSIEDIKIKDESKTVFICALPHGQSAKTVEQIHNKFPNSRIIDLSGDLRLKEKDLHVKYYPSSDYMQALRQQSVYGLPELHAELISKAKIISNPGCLATAAILSMLPLSTLPSTIKLDKGNTVVLNLATGSSGSGKEPKASTHHPVRHANVFSYKILDHQHEPEILQTLTESGLSQISTAFVPHSLPISRGIICTAYCALEKAAEPHILISHYKKYFANSPFVRVLDAGEAVEIENIVGSNFCDISITVKEKQIVIHSAIDNLVKGMAGQAIENLNIMFGFDRMAGLRSASLRPV